MFCQRHRWSWHRKPQTSVVRLKHGDQGPFDTCKCRSKSQIWYLYIDLCQRSQHIKPIILHGLQYDPHIFDLTRYVLNLKPSTCWGTSLSRFQMGDKLFGNFCWTFNQNKYKARTKMQAQIEECMQQLWTSCIVLDLGHAAHAAEFSSSCWPFENVKLNFPS